MNELMIKLLEEKDIVEELIKIDNEVMNTTYSFNSYYELFESILNDDYYKISVVDRDTVFVTEGDVFVTLELLKRMRVVGNVVIFINQGNVGMNKWLVTKYKEMTGNDRVILDTDFNYNKYIDKGYKVVPIGEDGLVDQVLEDFYG